MGVNPIPIQEFNELMAHRLEWCVSIYMPTRDSGVETQKGPIRLKNLLGEAEKLLFAKGERRHAVNNLLQEAENLLAKGVFWKRQRAGLALFLSPEMLCHYRLPLDFDEFVMVGDRFYIKPLLPLLSGKGVFYILALSLSGFRLFEGTSDDVKEIKLGNVSKNLVNTLKQDATGRQLQHHVVPRTGGKGNSSTIFHGQGADFSNDEENILRFVRAIDSNVRNHLKEENAPLVLAGVERLRSTYQKASTYSNILPAGISGNPQVTNPRDLYRSAWKLVQPYFQKSKEEAIARFYDLFKTKRASFDLKTIMMAAYHGQVDTLFLGKGVSAWGRYDRDNNIFECHSERLQSSDDLFDLAAVQTLANGGTVFPLEVEQFESGSHIAAIFRYPLADT